MFTGLNVLQTIYLRGLVKNKKKYHTDFGYSLWHSFESTGW